MTDSPVADFISESESLIKESYKRGYEDALSVRKGDLANGEKAIKMFLQYIRKHYRIALDDNGEFVFMSLENLNYYKKESVISTFILTYDE